MAIGGIAIGAVNELLALDLFAHGYPAPLSGPGTGYASFALQMAIGAAASIGLSLALEGRR